LEINVPFQHKYGYIRDDENSTTDIEKQQQLWYFNPGQPRQKGTCHMRPGSKQKVRATPSDRTMLGNGYNPDIFLILSETSETIRDIHNDK